MLLQKIKQNFLLSESAGRFCYAKNPEAARNAMVAESYENMANKNGFEEVSADADFEANIAKLGTLEWEVKSSRDQIVRKIMEKAEAPKAGWTDENVPEYVGGFNKKQMLAIALKVAATISYATSANNFWKGDTVKIDFAVRAAEVVKKGRKGGDKITRMKNLFGTQSPGAKEVMRESEAGLDDVQLDVLARVGTIYTFYQTLGRGYNKNRVKDMKALALDHRFNTPFDGDENPKRDAKGNKAFLKALKLVAKSAEGEGGRKRVNEILDGVRTEQASIQAMKVLEQKITGEVISDIEGVTQNHWDIERTCRKIRDIVKEKPLTQKELETLIANYNGTARQTVFDKKYTDEDGQLTGSEYKLAYTVTGNKVKFEVTSSGSAIWYNAGEREVN